ncbi:tRNA (adenosine(37)-N6)-dimethylallyltransferase MiaA [Hydrogenimonas sp.]
MKTIAILGPTASGKTELSIRLAKRHNATILSLDSLAIYKEIDIASAKPTPKERSGVPHFGIDAISPDTPFGVTIFMDIYREAAAYAKQSSRSLLIVGGTGFYLKTLMEGISQIPSIDADTAAKVTSMMKKREDAYRFLRSVDATYASRIPSADRYRIQKGLEIYFQTGQPPSRYFAKHPPKPIITDLSLFEIGVERDVLAQRISQRTEKMIEMGLVDEVAALEKRYGRAHNPMKAIGIVEVLEYFDGRLSFEEMKERIVIHTRQLAKRQSTFNSTQFPDHLKAPKEVIEEKVDKQLSGT